MNNSNRTRLPVSVSAAVYVSDNKGRLLLLQQAKGPPKGKWGPPAGGMVAHEVPIDTAKKKTKKELGVDVYLHNLIGIYTTDRGDKASGVGFAFRGRLVSKNISVKKDEISAYKYFTVEGVETLIEDGQIYKPEYVLPVLKDWIKGVSYPLKLIKPLIRKVNKN